MFAFGLLYCNIPTFVFVGAIQCVNLFFYDLCNITHHVMK